MSMNMTGRNIELTDAIKSHIEEKVGAAHQHASDITQIDVECDRNTHHNKGEDIFHVRITVAVPGTVVNAEESQGDLYAAIDIAAKELIRQLEKRKSKAEAQLRQVHEARREQKSAI